MVIITRSKPSGLNISITAQVHEYLNNLIKPLVTHKCLEEILYKFKVGIISKFKDKLREQNLKIQKLESKIHGFKNLKIISDDNEQYSHRSCLRVYGIEFKEGHSGDAMEEIEKCYNVTGIPFNENEIDRAHGIGKPFLDKDLKKKVRSIIVRFTSWKACAAFYKTRPKKICKWKEETRLNIV